MKDKQNFITKSTKANAYDASTNLKVTRVNQSLHGNAHIKAVRENENIFILLDIGIGSIREKRFLNAITISTYINGQRIIIGTQEFYNHFYNEDDVKTMSNEVFLQGLIKIAQKKGQYYSKENLKEDVEKIVDGIYGNNMKSLF